VETLTRGQIQAIFEQHQYAFDDAEPLSDAIYTALAMHDLVGDVYDDQKLIEEYQRSFDAHKSWDSHGKALRTIFLMGYRLGRNAKNSSVNSEQNNTNDEGVA
jgi:hypothetical protein